MSTRAVIVHPVQRPPVKGRLRGSGRQDLYDVLRPRACREQSADLLSLAVICGLLGLFAADSLGQNTTIGFLIGFVMGLVVLTASQALYLVRVLAFLQQTRMR